MPPPESRRVVDVLAALTATDRHGWSLLTGARDLEDVAERLRRVAALPPLPDIAEMNAPADRVPLVVGHGPGLASALPAIAAHRGGLWVIAPFRTAVALLPTGLVPDVIVLADRDTWPVHASLSQWQTLSTEQTSHLAAATLVVDAFAPVELVREWPRAFSVDTGVGAGTAVPLLGSSVLAALAIAYGLGHRHVGLGGADTSAATPLGVPVAELRDADDAGLVELTADGLDPLVEAGPQTVPRDPSWRPRRAWAPVSAARAVAARELDALAALLRAVEDGRTFPPGDARLVRLVDDIRWRWPSLPMARAAVHRAECPWLTALWEITAAPIQPLHDVRATQMTSRLVLAPLAEALAAHWRDCRACLASALGGNDATAVCP